MEIIRNTHLLEFLPFQNKDFSYIVPFKDVGRWLYGQINSSPQNNGAHVKVTSWLKVNFALILAPVT